MSNIMVKLKNGKTKEFTHVGRPGGSYTKTIRYEGNFAIITDEYGNETVIPSDEIESIAVNPHN